MFFTCQFLKNNIHNLYGVHNDSLGKLQSTSCNARYELVCLRCESLTPNNQVLFTECTCKLLESSMCTITSHLSRSWKCVLLCSNVLYCNSSLKLLSSIMKFISGGAWRNLVTLWNLEDLLQPQFVIRFIDPPCGNMLLCAT